jgi:hypothetical protein
MKKMKNALIALIFAFALLLAAQAAYSKSDNETLASEFLEEVAGVKMSAYTVISFDASRARMPDSVHYQTDMKIVLGNSNCKFEVLITYVDGRFWSYRLDMLQGELANETSTDGCLTGASRAVTEYQTRFNASYCNGFTQMIPTTLQAQEFTAEKDSIILDINRGSDTAKPAENVYLSWSEKINGRFITPTRSVTMDVSKTGIVTRLVDNMAVYQIASNSVNLAEQEAITLASQYVKAYANRNGQTVKTINATLDFASDITSTRGDRFLLYPRWTILATFDKTNSENVFGYDVMIWADTGAIYHQSPQGSYVPTEGNDSPYLAWPLGTAIFVIAVFFSLSTVACLQVRNRTRRRKNK